MRLAVLVRVADILHVSTLDEVRLERDEQRLAECYRLGLDDHDAEMLLAWSQEEAKRTTSTPAATLRHALRRIAAGYGLPFRLDPGEVDWRPDEATPEDHYAF